MTAHPSRWIEPAALNLSPSLVEACGGDELIASALYSRNIRSAVEAREFLAPADRGENEPFRLPGMEIAARRLTAALRAGERIGVWGDFDADGQTSTTILVQALRLLKADVLFHIPVRGPESHGISLPVLKDFLSKGVKLLITCDTGISALDAARECASRGVDLIITDHHTLPENLPPALALINPRFLPEGDPLYPLAGVGTAFQLVKALKYISGFELPLSYLLDLVALGTLADVAGLRGENRWLVKSGLECLRSTNRMAIRSILKNANCAQEGLNEDHVGFVLAPRLNAIGRLSDANPLVEFLLSGDPQFVNTFALQIEGTNGQRRLLMQDVVASAIRQLEQDLSLLDAPLILLSHPSWPGGVLGPAASRLVDRYQKPAIILQAVEGGIARGSARSVNGVDITEAIAQCADLLLSFGGHPMAAGLSLLTKDIPAFRSAIVKAIGSVAPPSPSGVEIAAFKDLSGLDQILADRVGTLAPFGSENPALVFGVRDVVIRERKRIGKTGEHTRLLIQDPHGVNRDILHWQSADVEYPSGTFDLAVNISNGSYRGEPQVTLEWIGYRQERTSISLSNPRKAIRVVDQREALIKMEEILPPVEESEAIVFREGRLIPSIPNGMDRTNLILAKTLILACPPPDWETLSGLFSTVQPVEVHLFAFEPAYPAVKDVLARLMGILKYVIRQKESRSTMLTLSVQIAETTVFTRLALEYFNARGEIGIEIQDDEVVIFSPASQKQPNRVAGLENALVQVFQESRAFRKYYLQTDAEEMIQAAA